MATKSTPQSADEKAAASPSEKDAAATTATTTTTASTPQDGPKAAKKAAAAPKGGPLPNDGSPAGEMRRNRASVDPDSDTIESERDLVAAPLEAPKERKLVEGTSAPVPGSYTASRESLRMLANATRITDEQNETPNPDEVFVGPDGAGHYTLTMRLIEHTTSTMYERPVQRLLAARGTTIPAAHAEVIKNRIRAQDAEGDDE